MPPGPVCLPSYSTVGRGGPPPPCRTVGRGGPPPPCRTVGRGGPPPPCRTVGRGGPPPPCRLTSCDRNDAPVGTDDAAIAANASAIRHTNLIVFIVDLLWNDLYFAASLAGTYRSLGPIIVLLGRPSRGQISASAELVDVGTWGKVSSTANRKLRTCPLTSGLFELAAAACLRGVNTDNEMEEKLAVARWCRMVDLVHGRSDAHISYRHAVASSRRTLRFVSTLFQQPVALHSRLLSVAYSTEQIAILKSDETIRDRFTTLTEDALGVAVSADFSAHPQVTDKRFIERRSVPRYNFISETKVFEPLQGIKLTAYVSDIGADGCYVHMATPLFKKALIQLFVLKGRESFQTWGEVIYTQEKTGWGLAFPDLSPIK